MKKVVITGGAGFIGSALAKRLQNECDVLVVDRFRNSQRFENGNLKSFGHFKNLLDFKGEVLAGDINEASTLSVIADFAPDVIFHQAAISDTTVSEQDELIKTNVNASHNLLKICQKIGAKMVYASSAATYGNASPQQMGKELPNNAYGYSKLAMERMALKWAKDSGGVAVGLRYFNVYGQGEFFKERTASMVLQLGLGLLAGKAPRLFEGSDKILRDFVYIDDVVSANLLAAKQDKSGVFNVGSGVARSFKDIADILQSLLNTNYEIEYIKNPYIGSYQFYTQADIKATSSELGYTPSFSLEDGIKAYLPEIKRIFKEWL